MKAKKTGGLETNERKKQKGRGRGGGGRGGRGKRTASISLRRGGLKTGQKRFHARNEKEEEKRVDAQSEGFFLVGAAWARRKGPSNSKKRG